MEPTLLLANSHKVKVLGADIDGISRGKIMSKEKFVSSLKNGGFGFCNVVFGWDMNERSYETAVQVSNSENDLKTGRLIPWENNLPMFIIDFHNPITLKPLPMCPRGLLKRLMADFDTIGMKPMSGIEFEFYNFKETPESLNSKKGINLTPLFHGMFAYSLTRPTLNQKYYDQIFERCRQINVDIEAIHTESGPGVYEVALKYNDALTVADNAHLFKTTVKQLGLEHGIMPSFMAKPYPDLPGCSGHIHVSLADMKGLNLFSNFNETSGMDSISDLMKQFLAGILCGLPSVMPLLAPTINSYKRLCGQFWAPNKISYGLENRTAAIRLIAPPSCPPSATRLEIRVSGSDVNPYLAIAAVVGCGLEGVKTKMNLPFGPVSSAQSTAETPSLPKNLYEATVEMMKKNSFARKVLGNEFVDHYGATRMHEWHMYSSAVTDWEVSRYMETV